MTLLRRDFIKRSSCTALGAYSLLSLKRVRASEPEVSKPRELVDRLTILDPWFYKTDLDAAGKAAMLNRIGVPRIDISLGNDPKRYSDFAKNLQIYDDAKIVVTGVYVTQSIDEDTLPQQVAEMMGNLKGRKTLVWFSPNSRKYKCSDPAGDESAVRLLWQASDLAKKNGLEISLYPHFDCWLERTGDAYRAACKTSRKNIGATFNLYHWLKAEGPENLEEKAKTILPKLNCVTINGSFDNAKAMKVEDAILPLGEGDTDVEAFVRTFIKLGYKGPFSLQGYGIGGDIEEKLNRSVAEWKKYCSRM